MTKKIANNPELDATLPTVPLELDGETFHLVFTFASLSAAAKLLHQRDIPVNLMVSANTKSIDYHTAAILAYAAILPSRPDVTLEFVEQAIDIDNAAEVCIAISEAYDKSRTRAEEKRRQKKAARATPDASS